MEFHQSVVTPLKNLSAVLAEPEKPKSNYVTPKSSHVLGEIAVRKKEGADSEGCIGVLEVFVHQARDIHNICIYHKQDVYAKACLTCDPEGAVSTHTINGGGKNPVFNESVRLNVRTVDTSLKCEIWMLSRVKNYLEDQLLGFALVPLSDVLVENGKLEGEFTLSSTDLFHSPAGFVQLTLSYRGDAPDVLAITPRASQIANGASEDTEMPNSVASDYDKIEFPDPDIVNENHLMVSQYFGIPCDSLDSQTTTESLNTSDSDGHLSSELGVKVVESFSEASPNSTEVTKSDTPASSVSTNGSQARATNGSPARATNGSPAQSFSENSGTQKSPNHETVSPLKEQSNSSGNGEVASNKITNSLISVNIEPEQTVVQQDYVDMYMKSMQQFTESLAKMKLPMDLGNNGSTDSGNSNSTSSSDQKLPTPKSTGSRVFYGSRAFF